MYLSAIQKKMNSRTSTTQQSTTSKTNLNDNRKNIWTTIATTNLNNDCKKRIFHRCICCCCISSSSTTSFSGKLLTKSVDNHWIYNKNQGTFESIAAEDDNKETVESTVIMTESAKWLSKKLGLNRPFAQYVRSLNYDVKETDNFHAGPFGNLLYILEKNLL